MEKKNTKNPIPGVGWLIQKWILDPTLEGTLEKLHMGRKQNTFLEKERSSWFLKVESANHSFLGFPAIARSLDALDPLVVVAATTLSGARL